MLQALAPIMLVIWTTIPGNASNPSPEMLAQCDISRILDSMSCYQQEAFVSSSVESRQYLLWAATILAKECTLKRWVDHIVDLEGFGQLLDIVQHYGLSEITDVPRSVLDAVSRTMDCIAKASSGRLQEYEELSDLSEFVKELLNLFRKKYHSMVDMWPVLMCIHPGHLDEVSGLCVAGLLQQVVDLESVEHVEYKQHCVYMIKLMERWVIAMGMTITAEWRADLEMYDHELSELLVNVYKRESVTAKRFVEQLQKSHLLREDSLLMQVYRVLGAGQQEDGALVV